MHLKVDSLNTQCFVLTFAGEPEANKIIMDLDMLPSPPLSTVASPQALALEPENSILEHENISSAFELNIKVSDSHVDQKIEYKFPYEVASSQLSL
jgi:hypothetical protein